jgi:hypothetical protein
LCASKKHATSVHTVDYYASKLLGADAALKDLEEFKKSAIEKGIFG